jgi:thiosulfate/3-mercaptopyruvate sulfurtransferase
MKYSFLFVLLLGTVMARAQKPENWTKDQLIEPAALAQKIQSGKDLPVVFCVGPGAVVPNSIDMGMAREDSNLTRFRQELAKYPRNASIVIYCGCCPFDHCPNVRPAIEALKEMHFTNYKLLDLPHNIRTDWISKGYPTTK